MKTKTRPTAFLFGILFLLASGWLTSSCKKSDDTPPAGSHNVSMQNDAFSPGSITVPVNSTVTWTNNDGYAHTVTSTSSNATYDSGNISAGGTYSHKYTATGTFNYTCTLHPGMDGTVVVQ